MRGPFVFASPPGLIASITSLGRRVPDRVPVVESIAQPAVGHVAIVVVGVLGEDRQNELVDRISVGSFRRDP